MTGRGGIRREHEVPWLALGTVVSRATGFGRVAVWTWALGLHLVGAAFAAGNSAPTLVYNLLVDGALAVVLVPQLVRAGQRGHEHERRFTDALVTLSLLLLAAATLVSVLAGPLLVRLYAGANWSAGDVRLAAAFAWCCAPQVFFWGLYGVAGQLAGVRSGFGPMMWAPAVGNLVWIAGGIAFARLSPVDRAASGAASASVSARELVLVGVVVGLAAAAQATLCWVALRRTGFRWRWSVRLRGLELGSVGRTLAWTLGIVAVNQVAMIAVSKVANTAGKQVTGHAAGMPTYVSALTILLLPHALVAVTRATATFPSLSAAAQAGELSRFRAETTAVLRRTVRGVLPAAVLLAALGPVLARIAFPGNPAPDAHAIGVTLSVLAPSLPLFSVYFVQMRALYAFGDGRAPFLVQAAASAAVLAGAVVAHLVLPPGQVVLGIAAGQSVAGAVAVVIAARLLRERADGPIGLMTFSPEFRDRSGVRSVSRARARGRRRSEPRHRRARGSER